MIKERVETCEIKATCPYDCETCRKEKEWSQELRIAEQEERAERLRGEER